MIAIILFIFTEFWFVKPIDVLGRLACVQCTFMQQEKNTRMFNTIPVYYV